MKKSNVIELAGRVGDADALTELLRVGARQLIEQAIEGLPEPRRHAAHDVQVGPVCLEELAASARV